MQWMNKAEREVRRAQRTWLCSFTLSPDYHVKTLAQANVRLRKSGVLPNEISAERMFKERASEMQKMFTDFMKRLRKQTNAQIRYLLVVESHKSGMPHLHALIHEVAGTVTSRNINGQWFAGFSNAKLVRDDEAAPNAVRYACKYLAKQAVSRVRASLHYGDTISLTTITDLSHSSDSGSEAGVKNQPSLKKRNGNSSTF